MWLFVKSDAVVVWPTLHYTCTDSRSFLGRKTVERRKTIPVYRQSFLLIDISRNKLIRSTCRNVCLKETEHCTVLVKYFPG